MFESVVWVSFGIMMFAFIFLVRYRALTYLLPALPVSQDSFPAWATGPWLHLSGLRPRPGRE